jgi:hypothetical protein
MDDGSQNGWQVKEKSVMGMWILLLLWELISKAEWRYSCGLHIVWHCNGVEERSQ